MGPVCEAAAQAQRGEQRWECLPPVAARAVFILEADDPVIGLVAFVPVGMSEVSSCVIDPTVTAGRHVDEGDDLGYFQFAGSTHCLVFQPGAIDSFALPATPRTHGAPPRWSWSAAGSPAPPPAAESQEISGLGLASHSRWSGSEQVTERGCAPVSGRPRSVGYR